MVAGLTIAGLHLHAQDVGIEYTAELQTDFRHCNFVNLLHLNIEKAICKNVSLEASTISIAKTRQERLVNDLQTFSNIEEENLPLAIAVCGASWQMTHSQTLFVGIRNINEDYFTSPAASFFTNSSCGVFPTISANLPIANYPVASAGLHYRYQGRWVKTQVSLYNGTGYNNLSGHESVFRICPKEDGIFGMAEAAYTNNGCHYSIGTALHWKGGVVPWIYAEQPIGRHLTLLAGCSHAFVRNSVCLDFMGVGVHCRWDKLQVGVFSDCATFGERGESATEITCKIPFSEHLHLQPTIHLITNQGTLRSVATLRMAATL